MSEQIVIALLAIIATLVGGLIWVAKAVLNRNDKLQENRDTQVEKALQALTEAVDKFTGFEKIWTTAHIQLTRADEMMCQRVGDMLDTQKEILKLLERLHSKVDILNGEHS